MRVVWENEKLRFQCETEEDYDPKQALQRMISSLERESERIKTEDHLASSDSAPEEPLAASGLNR